jgi:tetratricopeptide (TPR) repeat protein
MEDLVAQDPPSSIVIKDPALLHCRMAGRRSSRSPREHLEKALRACEDGLKIHPEDGGILMAKGIALESLAEHKFIKLNDPTSYLQQAEEVLYKAMGLGMTQMTYHVLGKVHLMRAQWEDYTHRDPKPRLDWAIEALDEALRQDLRSPDLKLDIATAVSFRARLCAKAGKDGGPDYEHALKECNEVLATWPNYIPAMKLKGVILFELARFAEAKKLCEEALRASPDDRELKLLLDATRKRIPDKEEF